MIPGIILFFYSSCVIVPSHQNGVSPDIDVLDYTMPGRKKYRHSHVIPDMELHVIPDMDGKGDIYGEKGRNHYG